MSEIEKELAQLVDQNSMTNEQVLDNIEKALQERDTIINSDTASDEEKKKAIEEQARINTILVNALRMQKAEDAKKKALKAKAEILARHKAKAKHKRSIQKSSRKKNRK